VILSGFEVTTHRGKMLKLLMRETLEWMTQGGGVNWVTKNLT
jgi:hypothetical protein